VKARGLSDGGRVKVTGEKGKKGSVNVLCITKAEAA
jgi:hypothetical protein